MQSSNEDSPDHTSTSHARPADTAETLRARSVMLNVLPASCLCECMCDRESAKKERDDVRKKQRARERNREQEREGGRGKQGGREGEIESKRERESSSSRAHTLPGCGLYHPDQSHATYANKARWHSDKVDSHLYICACIRVCFCTLVCRHFSLFPSGVRPFPSPTSPLPPSLHPVVSWKGGYNSCIDIPWLLLGRGL